MSETHDAPLPWTGQIDTPLTLFRTQVRREWLDEFDHVNTAHYITIGDHANWAFWNWINAPKGQPDQRDGHEYAVVASQVSYLDELAFETNIHVETQLLSFDAKRFILFHRIFKSDSSRLAATNEVKFLGFNLVERRAEAFQPLVAERLAVVAQAHASLEPPAQAGRGIALSSR